MSFPLPLIPFIFTKHTLPPFMSFCLWCRHQVRFARVPYRNVDAGLSLQPLRGRWVHGWGKHPHLIPLPHLRFSSLPSLDPSSIQSSGFPWRWLSWWLLRSPLFPGCTRPTWKVRRCVHMTCCWGFLSHTPLLTHPCGSHPQAAAAIRLFILTFNLWSS